MTGSLFAYKGRVITKYWHYSLIDGQMNAKDKCFFLVPVVLFIHLDSFDVSCSVLEVTSCICLLQDIMEFDGTLLLVLKVIKKKIHFKFSAAVSLFRCLESSHDPVTKQRAVSWRNYFLTVSLCSEKRWASCKTLGLLPQGLPNDDPPVWHLCSLKLKNTANQRVTHHVRVESDVLHTPGEIISKL